MKIAITVANDIKEELPLNQLKLDPRFGRCSYFIIYDLVDNTFEKIENVNKEATGGAGTATVQMIAKYNVESTIASSFGPNAVMGLSQLGIKMFISDVLDIETVINNFKQGKLSEINDANAKGHH